MTDIVQILSPHVFFIADAHFRDRSEPGEAARRKRFIAFTRWVPDGSTIFLLGDIFDFYWEYASVIPRHHFDIFHAIATCQARSVEFHFLGGNHDYWAGGFLSDDLGIRIHDDDFLLEAQGRKIRCAHGDMAIPNDFGYRVLRAVIRNRAVIKVAKAIHPNVMFAIARHVSGESKRRPRRRQEDTANHLAALARSRFFDWGNDMFIMGHVHYPLHRVIEGRDFVIVGDWIDHFSYAQLSDGRVLLKTFDG